MKGFKKRGGERVGKGNYWDIETGERIHIDEMGVLPGNSSKTYYSVPPAVILAVGPFLGLAYAMFLPFIGIAMVVAMIFRKLFAGAASAAWKGATFNWSPSAAYLSGKKSKDAGKDEGRADNENASGGDLKDV